MQPGYFKIQVTSAQEGTPIAAARIGILFADGTTASAVTDASGETELFEQNAPDPEVAQDPTFDGDVYSTVDIDVVATKFRALFITGIQIYAGNTTIVPASMEPFDITGQTPLDTPVVIEIPPNHINDRTEPLGDVPVEGSGLGVLDTVAIPETVTVHLGAPTSAAQNVTVSFPDYIKNVCCSEIYSTWPEAALRANIYCQISLTLNRFYTEWYRSRGFNFDITNSTSYDQFFVRGQSIAANVSKIVDEIFNIYIRKGNFQEPFYAEYCNGTTATCPGLKQWGTVTLANQGYTPLQILRYYYGNLVNLYETTTVEGVPSSYPGTPLRLGSTGASVTQMQTQLNRIRQNYPLIPAVTVNGTFDAATEAAVRTFQSVFNLTVDGIVGKATWYKISYIFVAVTKLAELGSEGIVGPDIPPTPTQTVRRGDSGETVLLAQFMLYVATDFYEELQPIAVDGVFGSATEDAVRHFQLLVKLSVDGVVGPNTWNALYDVYYSVFNAMTPINQPYPGTALRVGSRGTNVSLMQRYLNFIGRYFTSIPVLTIDAIFGNATNNAVLAFQRLFGLSQDGVIGPNTWNAIVNVYNALAQNT